MKNRIEKDFMGKKKVPFLAYYGIHTERAKENFKISGAILPKEIYYSLAKIKIAAAQSNNSLGILESKKMKAIIKAANELLNKKFDGHFVVDAYQAGEGTPTNMNVNEIIANRANELLGGKRGDYKKVHPNDHVNMSQSTNDVMPTAIRISSYQKIILLLEELSKLEKNFRKKAFQFKNLLKSGRTHLQDAVPISLGQEFHAYATSISRNSTNIKNSSKVLLSLSIGGTAVGTGLNAPKGYSKMTVSNLRKLTKLPLVPMEDKIDGTSSMTDFSIVMESLKILCLDLNKIANDLRLLSSGPSTGLNEINLPAVEPGSSIMPGKINPSIAECLNMICYQVIGNSLAVSEAVQAGQLQLNVMLPLIAHNLLNSLVILTNGIKMFNGLCVSGISANKKVLLKNFENNPIIITKLNPIIGYERAAEIIRKAYKENKNPLELLKEMKILSDKELKKYLNPKNLI